MVQELDIDLLVNLRKVGLGDECEEVEEEKMVQIGKIGRVPPALLTFSLRRVDVCSPAHTALSFLSFSLAFRPPTRRLEDDHKLVRHATAW
jgi:hypothetical protein